MTTSLRVEPYALPGQHDLPVNTVDWQVRADRAVLLIHDMQSYFLGAFDPDMRAQLVDTVAGVRKRCVERGARIAYTAQPGRMTDADRGLLRSFWGPGMTSTDTDRAIVGELAPQPADWTFVKWRYSAFFRSDLLARMRAEGRDQIILCGVYAHVGITATALEAYTNDIEVFMVADAIGDFSLDQHQMALRYTASCCAKVVTADGLLP